MSITPDQDPIFTLTTGPVDAYPEVLRGLARPVLYDYDPAFLGFYANGSRRSCARRCGPRTCR
jgi:pyridoxamine---pyruvate transaminase